jgi:glycosyltransferase involved in cell wall biosynthesis
VRVTEAYHECAEGVRCIIATHTHPVVFKNHRIAVVAPCYEVAAQLPDVIRSLPDFVDHVVVVDDGSTDRPGLVMERLRDSRVVVIRHETNRGLARAMETGFRKALELGADIVVKVDGDGQMDPAQMSRLCDPIVAGVADVGKGNRFLRRRHLAGMPPTRLLGNLALSFMAKLASGYWNIFDPTNGYLAIRRQVLEEIDVARLGPRYFFELSFLCQAYLAGAVVRDVSMRARYSGEKSSLSLTKALILFPFLLAGASVRRVALQHFLRDFTPVALFLLAGGLMSAIGLAYGVSTWLHSAGLHQPTPPGTIAVVGLIVLAGFHLLLQALVMDIGSVPARSPWASAPERLSARMTEESEIPADEYVG